MSILKSKLREVVVSVLYSEKIHPSSDEEGLVSLLMYQFKMTKKNIYTCLSWAKQVTDKIDTIDPYIKKYADSYAFDRIGICELGVLRLSIYEMLIEKKEPPKVCISEGIRLGKKFCSQESTKFINSLLDDVYKNECSDREER